MTSDKYDDNIQQMTLNRTYYIPLTTKNLFLLFSPCPTPPISSLPFPHILPPHHPFPPFHSQFSPAWAANNSSLCSNIFLYNFSHLLTSLVCLVCFQSQFLLCFSPTWKNCCVCKCLNEVHLSMFDRAKFTHQSFLSLMDGMEVFFVTNMKKKTDGMETFFCWTQVSIYSQQAGGAQLYQMWLL